MKPTAPLRRTLGGRATVQVAQNTQSDFLFVAVGSRDRIVTYESLLGDPMRVPRRRVIECAWRATPGQLLLVQAAASRRTVRVRVLFDGTNGFEQTVRVTVASVGATRWRVECAPVAQRTR